MSLRKTTAAVVLAGAFAMVPALAFGQAQYIGKGGTPGTASTSGAEAAAMGGMTAGAVAAGVAVAAAIAVAIAAASDDGDSTTTTTTTTTTPQR